MTVPPRVPSLSPGPPPPTPPERTGAAAAAQARQLLRWFVLDTLRTLPPDARAAAIASVLELPVAVVRGGPQAGLTSDLPDVRARALDLLATGPAASAWFGYDFPGVLDEHDAALATAVAALPAPARRAFASAPARIAELLDASSAAVLRLTVQTALVPLIPPDAPQDEPYAATLARLLSPLAASHAARATRRQRR